MATYGELKAKVGDWLSAGTARLPDSVRGDLINMQQRELLRLHDLRFGEISTTFATVTNTREVTLPATFSRPLKLWYLDSTGGLVAVNQIPEIDVFLRRYPDPTKTGSPKHFTIFGNQLWLGPTPGSVQTINLAYYAVLADLASDGDSNDFTIRAWEVLLWGALAFATKYMIEDARAPVFQENFERTLSQLLTEHSRARTSAGELVSQEPG